MIPPDQLRDAFRIGQWLFRPQLNRAEADSSTPRQLEPKLMQVLVCLASRGGEVVTRDEFLETVWPGIHVHDDVLSRSISELRKLFDDDPRHPRVIETIRSRGYRLVAPVEAPVPATKAATGRYPPRATATAALVLLLAVAGFLSLRQLAPEPVPELVSVPVPEPVPVPVSVPASLPLTSLPGSERDPAFSPDGSRLAFVWDQDKNAGYELWVQDVEAGTTHGTARLTESGSVRSPVFSPDGRSIAFLRNFEGAGVYLISTLGGAARLLARPAGGYLDHLAYSPDGRLLALAEEPQPGTHYRLVLVDVRSGELHRPLAPPAGGGGDFRPAFSPDGQRLAFARITSRGSLTLMVAELDGARIVGRPRPIEGGDFVKLSDLAWSRDGERLIVAASRGAGFGLWAVEIVGGAARSLVAGADDVVDLDLDPEGGLAYVEMNREENIWRLDLGHPTEAPRRIVASSRRDSTPRYSPDGRSIAFRSSRSGSHEIWIAAADGGSPRRLTFFDTLLTGNPAFSPDSSNLVFHARLEGHFDLHLVDVESARVRRLTTWPGDEQEGVFSSDGTIYFVSNDGGGRRIQALDIDSGQTTAVPTVGQVAVLEAFGEYLFYTRYDEKGLWRCRTDGGEALRIVPEVEIAARNWTVVDTGIYAVRDDGSLVRITGPTGEAEVLAGEIPGIAFLSGLSLDPDGHALLYARDERAASDVLWIAGLDP